MLADRMGLAGEQRLVRLRRTLQQHAVGREGLAHGNAYAVAGTQAPRTHLLHRTVFSHQQRRLRQPCRGFLKRGLGAVPGPHLQVPAAKQEAHEHGERIEVDLAAEQPAGVECGTAAGDERHGDTQRDRHVHADAALL
jgi:hypothetical protein